MKRIGLLAAIVIALSSSTARAQEEIIFRGKDKDESVKKAIKAESARGIIVAGAKEPISPETIVDVIYEVDPIDIRLNAYRPALAAEKLANDPTKEAKRQANLTDAIAKYEATLKGLKPGPLAQRHMDYKVAYLMGIQAQEGGTPDAAIARLTAFTDNNKDSWQLLSAIRMLAGLQIAKGQYGPALKSYEKLADANVSDEVKVEAQLGAAQVKVRSKNHAGALDDLNKLLLKLPKDSPLATRVLVAQAECHAAAKKGDEARKILNDVITKTKDPALKAVAYNTLGQSYFDAGLHKEARWQFLWVDVVYNQDRNEHAKALYYLMQIFGQLDEKERAQECRDTLLNDRQFQGLEFQRLAREKKAP